MAKNSLILKWAQIANVLEFINSDEIRNFFDDNAEILAYSFKENKDQLMKLISKERYERKLIVFEEIKKKEVEEGIFTHV